MLLLRAGGGRERLESKRTPLRMVGRIDNSMPCRWLRSAQCLDSGNAQYVSARLMTRIGGDDHDGGDDDSSWPDRRSLEPKWTLERPHVNPQPPLHLGMDE